NGYLRAQCVPLGKVAHGEPTNEKRANFAHYSHARVPSSECRGLLANKRGHKSKRCQQLAWRARYLPQRRLWQETITIERRIFAFRYLISGPVVPPLHTILFVSVILEIRLNVLIAATFDPTD